MVEQKPGSGIQNHDDLRGQHTIHGKHRGYLDSFFHHDLPEQERRGNAGGLFDQLGDGRDGGFFQPSIISDDAGMHTGKRQCKA